MATPQFPRRGFNTVHALSRSAHYDPKPRHGNGHHGGSGRRGNRDVRRCCGASTLCGACTRNPAQAAPAARARRRQRPRLLTVREAVADATAARLAQEGACVAIRLGIPERRCEGRPVVHCGQFRERKAEQDRNGDGHRPYDQPRQVQAHPVAAMRAAPRTVIDPIAASGAVYERGCVFTHEI
jgi:hypothetical protein